jgi:predicted metal-dependent hydrolase
VDDKKVRPELSGSRGTVRRVASEHTHGRPDGVEVRRSARRKRTVSAYRDGGRTVVLLPARMSASDERRWVALMLERLDAKERRGRRDTSLLERATALSRRFLDGNARPTSVTWVNNQASRWGSCTPADRSIRLSSRLQGMPSWVIDYVIVHELSHLLVPRHGPDFWALVERYPRTERARGYLLGVAAAAGLKITDDDGDVEP